MRRIFLAALAAVAVAGPAEASPMHYVGSFSTALVPWPEEPTSLSGTFSFTWDDSLAANAGRGYVTYDAALDSIDMDKLGNTAFTTTNTKLALIYKDGVFASVLVGSPPPGVPVGTVGTGYNDFSVRFSSSDGRVDGSTATFVAASVSYGISVATNSGPPSGMLVEAVPEPTSLAILGVGVVGAWGLAGRRRTG